MAQSSPKLSGFKVIGFDTMGTLLDEKIGINAACAPFRNRLPADITPDQLFAEFESDLIKTIKANSPPTTYASILANAITTTTHRLSKGDLEISPEESSTFAKALAHWPAFADTVAALQHLSQSHQLVLLSNMDTATLVQITTSDEGALRDVPAFAALLGGDRSGAFKPDHRVNQKLLDVARTEFGIGKSEVLLVAQGLWSDHVPAAEMGIASAWIDRYGAGEGAIPANARPTWVFGSLAELVSELRKQS